MRLFCNFDNVREYLVVNIIVTTIALQFVLFVCAKRMRR